MLKHERGENLTLFSRAHTRIYINPLATRSHCGAKMILFMRLDALHRQSDYRLEILMIFGIQILLNIAYLLCMLYTYA